MDDQLDVGCLVENHVWIRQGRHPPNGQVIRQRADVGMCQKQLDYDLNTRLNTPRALRRKSRDIVENRVEIGEGRKSIAKLHKPCLAQIARTCSSVANSPRAAAAFEASMDLRSS